VIAVDALLESRTARLIKERLGSRKTFCSLLADRDFGRFARLSVRNPCL